LLFTWSDAWEVQEWWMPPWDKEDQHWSQVLLMFFHEIIQVILIKHLVICI
jgi:hypothetical protein